MYVIVQHTPTPNMRFRSATGLQRSLVTLLVVNVVLSGLLVAGYGFVLWTSRSGLKPGFIAATNTAVMASLLLSLACYCVFLIWLYHIARNAQTMAPAGAVPTPGSVVGHYFIPFINLYLPLRDMRQIWQASEPASSDDQDLMEEPSFIVAWWVAYVAGWIVTLLVNWNQVHAVLPNATPVETIAVGGLLMTLLQAVSQSNQIALVLGITRNQRKTVALLGAMSTVTPSASTEGLQLPSDGQRGETRAPTLTVGTR